MPAVVRHVPVVGDLWAFMGDRLGFFESCAREGDCVSARFGPRRALVLSDPELIREAFVHEGRHFVRGITGATFRAVLGDGLLLSEGEMWRRQRRDVQPMFASEHVARWVPPIEAASRALVFRWSDGERRPMHHEMHRLTLDIAARLFLGVASDERGVLHPGLEAVLRQDVFRRSLPLGPLRWPAGPRNAMQELDALIYERIAEAAAGRGSHFVAALVRSAVDHREVRDQLTTLLFTAQDTTGSMLSWLWYLVARDERVEHAVREESCQAGAALDTNAHPYLMSVVNETLRLYPPVICQGRVAMKECEIAGATVRPGDFVLFSQWVIHRGAKWFERPTHFLPERWCDGLEDRLHPFAYFPFGGGRRVCVGRTLALAIAAVVVPTVMRQYRIVAIPGHEPAIHAKLTPRPKDGLPMDLQRLN